MANFNMNNDRGCFSMTMTTSTLKENLQFD